MSFLLFRKIADGLLAKNFHFFADEKAPYIFYKIVDLLEDNYYVVQFISKQSAFKVTLMDIVYDRDILYSLHPIQACYIGLEYADYLKRSPVEQIRPKKDTAKLDKYPPSRYGLYKILYSDRRGQICFMHKKTGQQYTMNPKDIALSENLIQEFDAQQAFYIGLTAGMRIVNPIKDKTPVIKPILRIIK